MSRFRFGIVGTGLIGAVTADAIAKSSNSELKAVSGRRIETAQKFVEKRPGVKAVQGLEGLLGDDGVDAIYIATPTATKEEIALAAIHAGKHVLVEKPFFDLASLLRITDAADRKGVVFMDATHFVHHLRTSKIKDARTKMGSPKSLHTTFYFPFSDRSNIRFDVKMEPMGALGDMAWYSMRAAVEFLRPAGRITMVTAVADRDPNTTAIVRASGLIAFESKEVTTFDIGYTAGTAIMDLELLGTNGVISMDDFVLDWKNSWAFKNPDIEAGYVFRMGMATRKEIQFVSTTMNTAQEVAMIENFAELAKSGTSERRTQFVASSLKTQECLDALYTACSASTPVVSR
jgi:predicted dehydrogenase